MVLLVVDFPRTLGSDSRVLLPGSEMENVTRINCLSGERRTSFLAVRMFPGLLLPVLVSIFN